MKNYLIFKVDGSPIDDDLNSPEVIASEIAKAILEDSFESSRYLAILSDRFGTVETSLAKQPIASLNLDHDGVNLWISEGRKIRDAIYSLIDSIADSYSNIAQTIHLLEDICHKSNKFGEISVSDDIDLDHTFEYIENTSEQQFSDCLRKVYSFNEMEHQGASDA